MSNMLNEAKEAPTKVRESFSFDQAVYDDLGARLRALDPTVVGTIARGSSDHAATYAAYLIPQATGRVVASIPPSLSTVLNVDLKLEKQFVLAVSQSGGSPDISLAVERARKGGALTAAIVNDTTSRLARTAEIILGQHAGIEKSIAATKTVICTLTAIARLVAAWTRDEKLARGLKELPETLEKAAELGMQANDQFTRGVSHAYALSRGFGLSSALEMALKFKECCGIHAEAFSAAEVRHGPREIVDENFLILALALPGSGHEDVLAVAREMKAQGARTMIVGPASNETDLVLPSISDERLLPIVALQALYPWLERSSRALGREPDRPKTLTSKVVETV